MVLSDSGDTSDYSEYSWLGLESHGPRKKDEKRYPCTYKGCQLVFSRPFRLAAHICVHTGQKPFPCKWSGCTKAYTNKSHLSRHVRSAHQQTIKPQCHTCSQCNAEFTTSQNLKKHISRLHECKYDYYCDICQTGFKKKNILAQHMYYHTGYNPFKCQLCGKTFAELIEFNKHKRNHKTFECFCKEVFTRWSDMVKHKKTAHTSSEFICDVCQKIFRSRVAISKHMSVHSTHRTVYQCCYDGCPKFYSSKYNLTFHIQSYHEHLTFNCDVEGCNAKLSTKAKLVFHMSKHNKQNDTPKKPKQPRQRKKRSDAGTYARSTAFKVIGIEMPLRQEMEFVKQTNVTYQASIK